MIRKSPTSRKVGLGRRLLGPTGHHADGGQEVAQFFTIAVVEVDGFAAPEPLGERGGPLGERGIFARSRRRRPSIDRNRSWAHLGAVAGHEGADAPQSTQMPHLGRPLADVEDRGDFRKTQLFEIVHHQDLAIDRRQLLQGRVHVPALFLAEQGMAGRRVSSPPGY